MQSVKEVEVFGLFNLTFGFLVQVLYESSCQANNKGKAVVAKKNMALENRIRRLAYEQQRAQKLTDIATEKASKLLDARDRHLQEVEKRMKMQDQRRQDLEGLRIRNFTSRAQSLQAKVMAQKSVVEVK